LGGEWRCAFAMSPLHLEKLQAAQRLNRRIVGAVYRLSRPQGNGSNTRRAGIRFDQVSDAREHPLATALCRMV